MIRDLPEYEKIELDFSDVAVFTPSWADEVITPLIAKYGRDRIILEPSTNASVVTTIDLLEEQWEETF